MGVRGQSTVYWLSDIKPLAPDVVTAGDGTADVFSLIWDKS